ncbi:MAG: hypothetical protein FJ294_06075 [Planctomycetes bacterium]|nr:hypothetical protein [Planctomycetota bacterium]
MKTLLLVASLAFGAVAVAGGVQSYLRSDAANAQVSFHADGTRRNSTEYIDGQKHGLSEQWHRDGKLEWQGHFAQGLRTGEWRFWNEAGELDSERSGTYAEGRRIAPLAQ